MVGARLAADSLLSKQTRPRPQNKHWTKKNINYIGAGPSKMTYVYNGIRVNDPV